MPIYEYYCESCKREFETLVFRSSDPVTCPTCSTENVQRVLSVCGFKSGGDKGAASSRMGSGASGCSGCAEPNGCDQLPDGNNPIDKMAKCR